MTNNLQIFAFQVFTPVLMIAAVLIGGQIRRNGR